MSILSRYINPQVLEQMAHRPIEPRDLVYGNLAGAHKSPLSGFAVEFAGHREYVAGDDPRHVDWRLYFKRDRLFIKQYELETNFVCHLLLDVSASMRYGDGQEQKLLYASQLAATLAYAIVRQNDKVSLGTFDEQVRGWVPPGNTPAQVIRMIEHLDDIKPVEKTRLTESLQDLGGRMGRREIVMICSDFFGDLPGLEEALQRLRYQRHEVVLFHILHHDEIAFDFEGMVKFQGLEVAEEHLTSPQEIRAAYLKSFGQYVAQLDEICQRNKIERVQVDTRRPLAGVILDHLNQRAMLRGVR